MKNGADKKFKAQVNQYRRWFDTRSDQEKIIIGVVGGVLLLLALFFLIRDQDFLFILAETTHFIGISVLFYKLYTTQNAAGLSLKSQVCTAVYLGVRLICSTVMEKDVHTILDLFTLTATGCVIYFMYTNLNSSYQKEADTVQEYYLLVPCAVLAFIAHPKTNHNFVFRILWAFCVYLEAVAVYPQLRMMQKLQLVEPFTGHYVFLLGLSRFFSCAHWIFQIRVYLYHVTRGLWPVMVLLSEIVQTFILADFCYFYVKSYASGQSAIRLPANVV